MKNDRALKILFIRQYKRRTGGHVTVRDYFMHSLKHPRLEPFVYFSPDSDMASNDLWRHVDRARFVDEVNVDDYDMFFVGGDDWKYLPEDMQGKKVINAILHVRHGKRKSLRALLKNPAFRICNSKEVRQAILPAANGPAVTIHNAVDFEIFKTSDEKKTNSVLIWGQKNTHLASFIFEALQARGDCAVDLQIESIPREAFAAKLQKTDVFVPLPNKTEGFYRPSLEGMASRCAVVCSDAKGNRNHCIDGETCLQPKFDNADSHLEKINLLLTEPHLKEKIRDLGWRKAQEFSLETQRAKYYEFLEKEVF